MKKNIVKTCFIIMPISDVENYPIGHFKRVYEYLIKPACLKAGFEPIRSDDIFNTNYIAIDILKRILTSDMTICDISSKNPNVLYELGIRQAFDLPVVLIKDAKTDRIFDIQGFRYFQYDEQLRVDNVGNEIDSVAETLTNTFESTGQEINSLISLLGINPAKLSREIEISKDTEIILNSISNLSNGIQEIGKEKSKFKELIWDFSHNVRRPVASLLGLIGLIDERNRINLSETETLEILGYIKKCAEDIDTEIYSALNT